MPTAKYFFSEEEQQRIVQAIRDAENDTSGEIRIHLEDSAKPNALERAQLLFVKLGIHDTAQHNGVLIYLAVNDKQFAIVGDSGINAVVPIDFWDSVRDTMQQHFRGGAFCEGLCAGIHAAGEKLKTFFPHQDDDINELSDEISYTDDN